MPRKQRIDTAAGAVSTMKGAAAKIEPPDWVSVPKAARPFWDSITRTRAADRWTEPDLENAAELARAKARLERLNEELDHEDDIIMNQRGTPVVNPKHALLETITRRVVALSRMLQIHAEATQGKSRDQVKANKAQGKARATLKESQDDDLIAQPRH